MRTQVVQQGMSAAVAASVRRHYFAPTPSSRIGPPVQLLRAGPVYALAVPVQNAVESVAPESALHPKGDHHDPVVVGTEGVVLVVVLLAGRHWLSFALTRDGVKPIAASRPADR